MRRDGRQSFRARACVALFLLSALVVGARCEQEPNTKTTDVAHETPGQVAQVSIDDDSNGLLDAEDTQTFTSGPAEPGVMATATSLFSLSQVRQELTSDPDTLSLTCRHILEQAGTTRCQGVGRGRFPLVRDPSPLGSEGVGFALSLVTVPDMLPAGATEALRATVNFDCGLLSGPFGLELGGDIQTSVTVPEDGLAPDCVVTISLIESEVLTPGPAIDGLHIVNVTSKWYASTGCVNSSQCTPGQVCGPDGECQEGKTADPCLNASTDCDAGHSLCPGGVGCSGGFAGSPCRFPAECAPGYTCVAGVCEGSPCSQDSDCPASASNCTARGCNAEGRPGDGCFDGFSCTDGLCVDNACQQVASQGEDCTGEFVVCDDPNRCFLSTGTCEPPLPLGSSCAANTECANHPIVNSCIAGVCSVRSSLGGPCEEGIDCQSGLVCDGGTGVCANP